LRDVNVPLDPHAQRLLGMLAAAGMPDVPRLAPHEMRQAFFQLARMVDAKDVLVEKVEEGELPGPAGPLPIRIYTPLSIDTEELPGLIYFHGGGGVLGSLDTHDGLCRMLANASGCRIVSVAYRLAPEHKFPAAVEDSYAATKWVAEHSKRLGIDPNRLAISGDSVGGGFAAVVCHMARQMGGPRLALQVLFCPTTDMSIETNSRRSFENGYFLNKQTLDWTLKHYCPPDFDLGDPRISPLRAANFAGLPPAHIHTAEFDPLRDEGEAYAKVLERAGLNVQYTCHEGMIHHFYCMGGAIPHARVAIKAAGLAIKEALTSCD
jgi:acetyl esterase